MKRKPSRSTVMALLISALCLCLCIFMVTGTTFGWFSDVAKSSENKILAGNLDIDLLMDKAENGTYETIAGENQAAAIFSAEDLWEPGKTRIVYLAVQNKGNLALKYNIELSVTDGGLVGALDYAIIDGAKKADLASVTDWTALKAATTQTGKVTAGTLTAAENGVLDEITNGTKDETQYFALAVHMDEAAGNAYQEKYITIDVTVKAAQYTAESDSFSDQYDKNATFADSDAPAAGDSRCLTFSSDAPFSLGIYEGSTYGVYAEELQSSTDQVNWSAFKVTMEEDTPVMPSVTAVKNSTDNKYYIYLRGDNMTSLGGEISGYNVWTQLTMTADGLVDCSGNIMTLLDYDNPDVVMGDKAFYRLFCDCTALRSAPSLPATALTEWCYFSMFQGCTSLTKAPEIAATTLSSYSCWYMFEGCSSLSVIPCEAGETGFVTIPSGELPFAAVDSMFKDTPNANTIGEYGTPEAGKSYKVGACFVADTQITMADGSTKSIEDIAVGDRVLAYDTILQQTYKTTVLSTSANVSTAIVTVTLTDGTQVECTPTHPLLTTDGFKSVNPNYTDVMKEYGSTELRIGDRVVTENGTFAVQSIHIEKKAVAVYNFHVLSNGAEVNCTYIANGIIVHNGSGC